MTTTITLPEPLATQLKQHAITRNRSVETLAIEYLVAALTEAEPPIELAADHHNQDDDLRALVDHIQQMPPNPVTIVQPHGKLVEVLAAIEAVEAEPGYDWRAEYAALQQAELALRAMDWEDDVAQGRS